MFLVFLITNRKHYSVVTRNYAYNMHPIIKCRELVEYHHSHRHSTLYILRSPRFLAMTTSHLEVVPSTFSLLWQTVFLLAVMLVPTCPLKWRSRALAGGGAHKATDSGHVQWYFSMFTCFYCSCVLSQG